MRLSNILSPAGAFHSAVRAAWARRDFPPGAGRCIMDGLKEVGILKVLLKENKERPLTVTVEYPLYDSFVERLVRGIRNLDGAVFGFECGSGARRKISIADILYIESVEKRTFIYTAGSVFGADCRLYEIEARLARRGIIRISKSCLMNIAVLESIRRLANSRLEAVLENGMRLIVSRTYLKGIRDYLASEGL